MKNHLRVLFWILLYIAPSLTEGSDIDSLYTNPIIMKSLPDPTIIKATDGKFYLYATEDTRNMPIYQSDNLMDWNFIGTVFCDESRPSVLSKGGLWAPDINYINGRYVLYYTQSRFDELEKNGIGVAVSNLPAGPFLDLGKLFTSEEIGVKNSIDQFYYEEKGKKYLFWGSMYGIYGIELAKDGLTIKRGARKRKIAGSFMEGTAIERRNGFYYLFGSAGFCCNGDNSSYHITYGRSKNLFGPYKTKEGKLLLDNYYDTLIKGDQRVAGPGHQSRLVTDDKGQDWIIYHGYMRGQPEKGRVIFLDRVKWIDGWPVVEGEHPSVKSPAPCFNNN